MNTSKPGYIERGNKIWYTENFSAYGVTTIYYYFALVPRKIS